MIRATLTTAGFVAAAFLIGDPVPTDVRTDATVYSHPDAWRFDRPVEVAEVPTRGTAIQVVDTTTIPPPTTSEVPVVPIPGDCESWRRVILDRGGSAADVDLFIDRKVLYRETRCGLDNLNERTGDSGVCQINPVHNRAGYFDGVEYGSGGWLLALHGLRTREDVDAVEWIDACMTLRSVCGSAPWTPPYGCKREDA